MRREATAAEEQKNKKQKHDWNKETEKLNLPT